MDSFGQRAEREGGEEGQGDDDDRHADDHADEQRPVGGQRARRRGDRLLAASDPARPSTKMIGRNRPNTMARPSAVFHQGVLTVMPANAEPLLLDAEVNA